LNLLENKEIKIMKYILIFLILIPSILFAQEKKDENKRIYLLFGTSQGVSFMNKEANSNTTKKTFEVSPGYAFSYGAGINITSKSGKSFSEITVNYRSLSNGIKNSVDVNAEKGFSSKTSYDRFNYLTLDYRYSKYVKTIGELTTFFSLGIQSSYILNEKKTLNYEESSRVIKTKGKEISDDFVISTTPTFLLSYGAEFNKGILNVGSKSRLSLDFTYDSFLLGIASSPSNQYFSTMINYRLML